MNRTLERNRASAKIPAMGLRVRVGNDSPSTEPGLAALVPFEVVNEDSASQTVEVSIEGLDPTWLAIPVPVFQIGGSERAEERVFVRPPREPESIAGVYPFVLKVRSSNGEESAATLSLEVRPYHNVSVDVQPRRAMVSPIAKQCTLHATVMNLGNTEHTFQLSASDLDDLFVYSFEQEQVTVSPGAQKSIAVTVTPKKAALLASARLQQFTVSCRSVDNKTIASVAHGQIEQRALVTPSVLGLLTLMLVILSAFVFYLPKAPVLDTLTILPERPTTDKGITIKWSSTHARSVRILFDGVAYEDLDPSGSKTFVVEEPGEVDVRAWALSGRRTSREKAKTVVVRPPDVVPEPVIEDFRVEPAELEVGQTFQVFYTLSDSVTSATLSPIGLNLDPRTEGVQLTAQFVGEVDYKLVASNSAGQTTEKSVRVKIAQGSSATIIVFRAEPALVDPIDGRVTVTWQVANADRVELAIDDSTILLDNVAGSGTRDFVVNKDTTFKLVVYDNKGVTREREVSIRIKTMDDFVPGGGGTR